MRWSSADGAQRGRCPTSSSEVTPAYLLSERAPDRVRARIPAARLVAVLRHPVGPRRDRVSSFDDVEVPVP